MARRPFVVDIPTQPTGLASLATGAATGFASEAAALSEEARREQIRQSILQAKQAEDEAKYARERQDKLADMAAQQGFQRQMLGERERMATQLYWQRRADQLSDVEGARAFQMQQEAEKVSRQQAEQQAAQQQQAQRARMLASALGVPSGPTPAVLPFGGAGQAATFNVPLPELTDPRDVETVARENRLRQQQQRGGSQRQFTPEDVARGQELARRYSAAKTAAERNAIAAEARLSLGMPLTFSDPARADTLQQTIANMQIRQLNAVAQQLSSRSPGTREQAALNFLTSNGIDPKAFTIPEYDSKGKQVGTQIDIARVYAEVDRQIDAIMRQMTAPVPAQPASVPNPQAPEVDLDVLDELDLLFGGG